MISFARLRLAPLSAAILLLSLLLCKCMGQIKFELTAPQTEDQTNMDQRQQTSLPRHDILSSLDMNFNKNLKNLRSYPDNELRRFNGKLLKLLKNYIESMPNSLVTLGKKNHREERKENLDNMMDLLKKVEECVKLTEGLRFRKRYFPVQ